MEAFPQVIAVDDPKQGLIVAKNILYKKSGNQTLLLLSGGSTPKELYEVLAQEKKIKAKIVGMVDERKDRSNFEMIKSTGLLDYFQSLGINFYPITSVTSYKKEIIKLFNSSKNKIAIMGIGEDGHTAGLPSGISNFHSPAGEPISSDGNLVIDINNFPGEFKERMTLTFKALAEMDLLIILAFGPAKKNALRLMFEDGLLEEIPARFYLRSDIVGKTILITDQKI